MANPNPLYGTGIFRRRIHLRADGNTVAVELEDGNHGFRIVLRHDGEQVTDICMDALRHPFNTCPEAISPLRRIVGHRLDSPMQALRGGILGPLGGWVEKLLSEQNLLDLVRGKVKPLTLQ